jgi:hypothetical protein
MAQERSMTTGLVLMAAAAVHAQFAHWRRFDRSGISRRVAWGAILYALAGIVCFVTTKVVQ